MKYQINVNDTPEKKDFLVVIIIDDESKTSSTFALGKKEKSSVALKLIKSALAKVNILNTKECKNTNLTPKKQSKKLKTKPASKKK